MLHERFDWYSNKGFLHSTNESDSEEVIPCIGWLEYVKRWDDDCRNIRRLFLCPLFIALNNMFINALDCEDQRIETMDKLNLLVQNTVTLFFRCRLLNLLQLRHA